MHSDEEEEALPVAFVDLMSDGEDEDSDAGSDEEWRKKLKKSEVISSKC